MNKLRLQTTLVNSMTTLFAVFALSLPSMGQSTTPPCSNRTLQGDYAFSIEGAILRGVAMTHFDGQGNLSQVDHVVVNGIPPNVEWRVGTGTYTVNPDCTGTAQIKNDGRPPVNLRFVLARQGKEIHTVVTDPGSLSSSYGVKRD